MVEEKDVKMFSIIGIINLPKATAFIETIKIILLNDYVLFGGDDVIGTTS